MKKTRLFALLSGGSYAFGLVLAFMSAAPVSPFGPFYEFWAAVIFVLVGLILAFISDSRKESSWIGNLLAIIGVLLLFLINVYVGLGLGFSDMGNNGWLLDIDNVAFLVLIFLLIFLTIKLIRRAIKKISP